MLQFVSEKERKFRVFIVLRVWSFLDTHERKTLRPSFYIPSLLWTRCCEGTLLLRYSWRLIHPYIQNIMPIWNQILHTIHIERIAKDVINANVMFDDINWWLLPLTSLMKIQHNKKNFKSLWINSSMKLQFNESQQFMIYSSHLDNKCNLNKVTYAKSCPNLLDQPKANMFCIQTRGIHSTNSITYKLNSDPSFLSNNNWTS